MPAQAIHNTTPEDIKPRLLRWRDVQQQIPISRSSWYQGVKEGRFPQPVKIGPKTSAWLQSDIDKFIAKLAAQ